MVRAAETTAVSLSNIYKVPRESEGFDLSCGPKMQRKLTNASSLDKIFDGAYSNLSSALYLIKVISQSVVLSEAALINFYHLPLLFIE